MSRRINRPLPYPYRDIFKDTEEQNCADIESGQEVHDISASSEESAFCRADISAAVIFILLVTAFRKDV